METQALPTLRPLRLGELLDQSLRLYRRNFLTFIGIIALVYVPLTILQTAATALMSSSALGAISSNPEAIFTSYAFWIGWLGTIALAFIQFVLVQGIATGAMTRAVADNYLGRQTSILDAYRGISGSWVSLLGALFFIIVLYIVALIWWIVVPCVGWFTGLGMMAFLLGAINPLAPSVVVLERQGAVESVRRAWSLARRQFWRVLGYVIVLYLFSLIVVAGPSMVINLVLQGALASFRDPALMAVVSTIVQSLARLVVSLIYYPVQMTAFTLIYFDLRVRTEGFDLALQTIDPSSAADLNQALTPPPAPDERFMTGQDLGNFAILTLAGVGIYILFFSVIMGVIFLLASSMPV